jgi:hypothetical protein
MTPKRSKLSIKEEDQHFKENIKIQIRVPVPDGSIPNTLTTQSDI